MAENNNSKTTEGTIDRQKENTTSVVIYSRVSSSKQRGDLKRQTERLKKFVEGHQGQLVKKYQDSGSGLNDQRKGLLMMIKELPIIQPEKIVCSYPDRLTRFGIGLIKTIGELFDTEIVFMGKSEIQKGLEGQLVEDVLAVLTSFAGKIHRARRGRGLITDNKNHFTIRDHQVSDRTTYI